MIKGIWNYTIKARDVEATTQFYLDHMAGELKKSGVVLGSQYRLIRMGQTLMIVMDKAPYEDQWGWNLPYGFLHIVYEVTDHDKHVEMLRQGGAKFLYEPTVIETDWDTRKIAFFEYPEGARTEIMQILKEKEPV